MDREGSTLGIPLHKSIFAELNVVVLGARPESPILPNFGPKPRLEFGPEDRISEFSAGPLEGSRASIVRGKFCTRQVRVHSSHSLHSR